MNEYVTYYGVRMIIKRRFVVKGVKKIEIYNPKNTTMFIVNEDEVTLIKKQL